MNSSQMKNANQSTLSNTDDCQTAEKSKRVPSELNGGPSKVDTWAQRLALLAIVLTATYTMSINVADPDLWGHVQYGNDVLADGYIHETTTYSYTAVGFRWINHENLAELTFAGIVQLLGPIGLLILKFAMNAIVVGLIVFRCQKQGIHLLVIAATVLLAGNAICYFWSIRPQLFTFTYFALMIALLNWCFKGWNDHWNLRRSTASELEDYEKNNIRPIDYSSSRLRYLWLAPVMFLFWANSHGGFVAGVAIYVAYLGLRGIETYMRFGRHSYGLLRRFMLMSVVAILATMINPYGPGLHGWLLQSLGQPRPEITEWAATNFLDAHGWRFGLVILIGAFSLIFSKKEKDFTQIVLLGLTLWQAIEHHRHVPFFSLFFAFWIPVHLQSALSRFKLISLSSTSSSSQKAGYPVLIGSGVCVVVLAAVLFTRVSVIRVEKDRFPVAAFDYLIENEINGKMIVTYNWAQYAIAAFKRNPDVTGEGHIAFDGRFRTCYPQQIVDMHFDFICGNGGPDKRHRGADSPPYDGSRILKYKNPELVIISRRQKHSVRMMDENKSDWGLLYQDELTQVWGVKEIFDDPQHPKFVSMQRREIGDEPQIGYAAWPAIRSKPTLQSGSRNSQPNTRVIAKAYQR